MRHVVPDLFLFSKKALYEVKASGLQLSLYTFRQPSTWHTIKTNFIQRQNIDLEICSILSFQKRVWEQFLHHILCIIFRGKRFSYHILLTDQLSLSDYFYFSRYCVRYLLQLFATGCNVINFETNLIFLINSFFYVAKKSTQKFKYLRNKNNF